MQLLVSVRNAKEAAAALAGGADLIDVKEPTRGALGYADADALRTIASAVGGRAPLSAALGEISAPLPISSLEALSNYQYAKLGLAGTHKISDWPLRWRAIVAQFPQGVRPVGVVYADAAECGAPTLTEVLPHACALQCAALLVDTFAKDGRTIFDCISHDELADVVAVARHAGLRVLLAGSVGLSDIAQLATLSPDVVAVRGAVCRGGRAGSVDTQRVAEFRAELARNSHNDVLAPAVPIRN